MRREKITFDEADLLSVFGEVLPLSDKGRGIYWFKSTRPDGISVVLTFSSYELSASVIVRCNELVACSSVEIKDCSLVRVLDAETGCLEVLAGDPASPKMRCLLCVTGDNILEVTA